MYRYQREEWERKHNPLFQLQEKARKVAPQYDEPRYISLMTSISHTYGNVIAFMREWLLEQFPKNMFKTVHVNSKIAHKQLRTNQEFFKKARPMLIMRPRVADWSEDRFLKGTMLTERQTAQYHQWGGTNLMQFIKDPAHGYEVKYQMNRSVIDIDVILVFETAMQQLDFTHYIANRIAPERPFFINANLESYIPLEMLQVMSTLSGVPIYDNDGFTKGFLDYIEGCSNFPLTYKLQGSTGKREFFRYYNENMEVTLRDLQHDDGDRIGQTSGRFQITFTLRVEFNSTGFYYLFSRRLPDINLPTIDPEDMLSSGIIPLFSDVISRDDINLPTGWSIHSAASAILEKEYDDCEFKELLNASILKAIEYHKNNGLPLLDFFDVKVRRQGQLLHYGTDYTIDMDTFTIHFKNTSTYFTYRVIVCVNATYINELVKNVYNLE